MIARASERASERALETPFRFDRWRTRPDVRVRPRICVYLSKLIASSTVLAPSPFRVIPLRFSSKGSWDAAEGEGFGALPRLSRLCWISLRVIFGCDPVPAFSLPLFNDADSSSSNCFLSFFRSRAADRFFSASSLRDYKTRQ